MKQPQHIGTTRLFTLPRFFWQDPDAVDTLPADIALIQDLVVHHIRSVRRLKPDAAVIIVDSKRKQAYLAEVKNVQRQAVTVTLTERLPAPATDAMPEVTLAVGLMKGSRWDTMLEKVTELGVSHIVPLQCERTVVEIKDEASKQARWQHIVQTAAQQSERLTLPTIHPLQPVRDYCKTLNDKPTGKLLALERPHPQRVSFRSGLETALNTSPDAMTVAIGPEGGWHDNEIEQWLTTGYQPTDLGPRILRVETACLWVMSSIGYATLGLIDN